MTSFLQSSAWEAFQSARGLATIRDSGKGWSYLAIKESGAGNTRIYTPYGPECSSLKAFDSSLVSLKSIARTHKATLIRVDSPTGITASDLKKRGFRPVTYQQLQPAHTQLIDLTESKDEILAHMSQNSRNITRNYHKKGITIRTSYDPEDITILTSLLARVASRNNITPHSDEYFKTQAQTLLPLKAAVLYIAELDDSPIAASLVYDSETTRTYAHAAADDAFRKLNAGTALVGQMILDAKDAGLTTVDLYGISPTSDPDHPWAGFTKFKQSFGGRAVSYVGTWDLPVKPLRYWMYRTYQSIRRALR